LKRDTLKSKKIASFIEGIVAEVGKDKAEPFLMQLDDDVEKLIRDKALGANLEEALYGTKKEISEKTAAAQEATKEAVLAELGDDVPEL
jgi:hypothetical protein